MEKSKNEQSQTLIGRLEGVSGLGIVAILLASRYWPQWEAWAETAPWLAGAAMLPFTLLAGIAAWLNHTLPPGAKAPWDVWRPWPGWTTRISHPYMTFALAVSANILAFGFGWSRIPALQVAALVPVLIYLLVNVVGGVYLERKYKRARNADKHGKKGRRRNRK